MTSPEESGESVQFFRQTPADGISWPAKSQNVSGNMKLPHEEAQINKLQNSSSHKKKAGNEAQLLASMVSKKRTGSLLKSCELTQDLSFANGHYKA